MSLPNYTNPAGTEHYVHTWTTETDGVYPDGSHTNHIVLLTPGDFQTLTVVNISTSIVQTVEIVAVRYNSDGKQDISYQFCDDSGRDFDDSDITWYKLTAHFRLKNGKIIEVCAFYPVTTRYDYTDDEADYGYEACADADA